MKRARHKTPETAIKDEICEFLTLLPGVWWQRNVAGPVAGGSRQRRGLPDLVLCVDGRFLAIEVKANAKLKPTDEQRNQLAGILAAGGDAHVVSSMAEVQRIILALRAEHWSSRKA